MSPTPTNPTDRLREAAEKLRAARFSGAITATPTVAALIGARLPLADWLEAEAAAPITAQHSTRCVDPQCTTLAALTVARRVLGTTNTETECPECGTTGACNGGPCPLTTTPAASGERPDHALYVTLRKYGHTPAEAQQMIDTYTQKILTRQGAPAVDRAAVLREAADVIERMQHDRDDVVNDALGGLDRITEAQHTAVHRAAAGLRCLAAEAQQPAEDAELTAEEAREMAAELGTELYQAQDALAFVGECCDIADREQRPVTTADVREWLKGARCGRQLAADAEAQQPAPAETEEPTP